jgi:hypothetical protein
MLARWRGDMRARWWRETITQRRRGREDAEFGKKVGCAVGEHSSGRDVKRKDAGEVVWDLRARSSRPARRGTSPLGRMQRKRDLMPIKRHRRDHLEGVGDAHAETLRVRGRRSYAGRRQCLDTRNVCFTIQLLRNIVRIT